MYKKGIDIPVADALSCVTPMDPEDNIKLPIIAVNMITTRIYKKGIDIPVADALSHVTPMDPEDNIKLPIIAVNMITTRILMSVKSQGSFSSKLE